MGCACCGCDGVGVGEGDPSSPVVDGLCRGFGRVGFQLCPHGLDCGCGGAARVGRGAVALAGGGSRGRRAGGRGRPPGQARRCRPTHGPLAAWAERTCRALAGCIHRRPAPLDVWRGTGQLAGRPHGLCAARLSRIDAERRLPRNLGGIGRPRCAPPPVGGGRGRGRRRPAGPGQPAALGLVGAPRSGTDRTSRGVRLFGRPLL